MSGEIPRSPHETFRSGGYWFSDDSFGEPQPKIEPILGRNFLPKMHVYFEHIALE